MLAFSCIQCAAPVPVSLKETERFTCPHCDAEGALPEEVQRGLKGAQRVLDGLVLQHRQLDARRRQVLAGANKGLILFGISMGFLLLMAPCYLCGGVSGLIAGNVEQTGFGVACTWMLTGFLLVAPWLGWKMVQGRRELERVCSAIPPQLEGDPARCYVCGGTLAAKDTDPVVRCGYCQADNLVSPLALERAKDRREIVLEGYALSVRTHGEAVGTSRAVTNAISVVGTVWLINVLLAPLTIFVTAGLIWAVHGPAANILKWWEGLIVCVPYFLLFLLIGIVAILAGFTQRSMRRAWTQVANRTGLQVEYGNYPKLSGTLDGFEVVVDAVIMGEKPTRLTLWTRVRVILDRVSDGPDTSGVRVGEAAIEVLDGVVLWRQRQFLKDSDLLEQAVRECVRVASEVR